VIEPQRIKLLDEYPDIFKESKPHHLTCGSFSSMTLTYKCEALQISSPIEEYYRHISVGDVESWGG